MIKLFLNGEEYMSSENEKSNCNKLLESGFIHGNYYGSSTCIIGKDIWHPENGYSIIRISIQIKISEESDWLIIFDQNIDFCEESIKLIELQNLKLIELEKNITNNDDKKQNIQKLINNNNRFIDKIRSGIICNVSSGTKIIIKNDLYEVILFFRDLHRFEGQVQISGCCYKLL